MTLNEELEALGVLAEAAPPAAPKPDLKVVAEGAVNPVAVQWLKWRDRFAEAMSGSFHTIEALEQMVFQGRVQFWPGRDAAVITEVVSYAGGETALQGLWGAGDLDEIRQMIPGLESYGRLRGCTSVLIEGRAGWVRALKDQGFEPWSVTVRKAL